MTFLSPRKQSDFTFLIFGHLLEIWQFSHYYSEISKLNQNMTISQPNARKKIKNKSTLLSLTLKAQESKVVSDFESFVFLAEIWPLSGYLEFFI